MPAKRKVTNESASRWIGYPVCVVLKDGSYYIGMVTGIENDELILSGAKGQGKMGSRSAVDQAQVSSFLGSLFGGGGLGGGLTGGSGFPAAGFGGGPLGFLGKIWPGIRLGMGMLRMIMPLMGGFKI